MKLRSLSLILVAAALSACAGGPAEGPGPIPLNPAARYSLQVEPGLERIALAVHEAGVSQAQAAALHDIAARFLIEGAPSLVVETPAGDDPAAGEMAWRVREVLRGAGVPDQRIQMVGYTGPDARAPVLVGYETIRAAVPRCGTEWGSLTRSANNAGHQNFGCAVTANLAAQIANPRDILQPRNMDAADMGRRSVVFDNYRRGLRTATPQEELVANRRVANAVE